MCTIIVAYDKNKLIGKDNKLPWHIPDDLLLFKKRTMNQAVIMGRKTYDSLPNSVRPLPGRLNIVLSRTPNTVDSRAIYVKSPQEALEIAATHKMHPYVIGGEQVYKAFLEAQLVTKVIASVVDGNYEGDTWFPNIEVFDTWVSSITAGFKQFKVVEFEPVDMVKKDRDLIRSDIHQAYETIAKLKEKIKQQHSTIQRLRRVRKENITPSNS